jgi:hypothetical protein
MDHGKYRYDSDLGRIASRCCTHHPEAGKGQEKRKIQLWLQLCPLRHVGLLPPEVTKQQAGRRGWKHLRFPFALTGGKQWLTKTH